MTEVRLNPGLSDSQTCALPSMLYKAEWVTAEGREFGKATGLEEAHKIQVLAKPSHSCLNSRLIFHKIKEVPELRNMCVS